MRIPFPFRNSKTYFINIFILGAFGCGIPGEIQGTPEEYRENPACQEALKKALGGQGKKALGKALKARCGLSRKIIQWMYYQQPELGQTFKEVSQFVLDNPDWPHLKRLRSRAEELLDASAHPQDVQKFFDAYPPLTGRGGLFYVQALLCQGHGSRAQLAIEEAWAQLIFNAADEATFLKRYHGYLKEKHHKARLDWLLWMDHQESAQRLLKYVPLSYRLLAQGRLALKKDKKVFETLQKVPPLLAQDPGLLYDRLIWYLQKNRQKEALALISHPLKKPLPYPELWWKQKYLLIRDYIRDKKYPQAYKLALHHQLPTCPELSEAEWISGWLALRCLHKPIQAKAHFINMYHHVETPISRAKGAYWIGRSCEMLHQPKEAKEWYQKAAHFPTTFYGQLAQQKIGISTFSWHTPPRGVPPHHSELLQAAILLQKAGGSRKALPFLKHFAIYARTAQEQQQLIELVHKISGPYSGHVVEVAKKTNRSHEVRLKDAYPVIPIPSSSLKPSLILGIIRQESCFDAQAKSNANALGMMQLVPQTAREMAKKIGIKFHLPSLTQNPSYNIKLGVTYFEKIVKAYEGSVILALAAYNAGIGRVRKWIKDFGNPQDPSIDPIDWIEMIPFGETRSYVHRVLEGAYVYEKLLQEKPPTSPASPPRLLLEKKTQTPRLKRKPHLPQKQVLVKKVSSKPLKGKKLAKPLSKNSLRKINSPPLRIKKTACLVK